MIGLATKPTFAKQRLFDAVLFCDVSSLSFSNASSVAGDFFRSQLQGHDDDLVSTLVPVPQCLLVPSHVALLLLQDAIHYALDDARCGHVPASLHARVAHSPGCDVVCSSLPPSGAKAPKWFPCSKGTPLRGACEGLQGLYLSTDIRRCADCASQDPGLQLHANAPDRDHFSLVST